MIVPFNEMMAISPWHLGRGLSRSKLDKRSAARRDFENSLRILPTAIAYNELGQLAERDGNEEAALRYYAQAAKSGSAAGQQAAARYLNIDLPRQPANYVKSGIVNTAQGPRLWVKNDTRETLTNIQIRVSLTWAERSTDNYIENIRQLRAGAETIVALKLRDSPLLDANAYTVSAEISR